MIRLEDCLKSGRRVLMEGALGERLKREYHLSLDENVVMGNLVDREEGRSALRELWTGYAEIAACYGLPFLATTPTRRLNRERAERAGADRKLFQRNVEFLRSVLGSVQRSGDSPAYAGGLAGCRGDAYTGEGALDRDASRRFHSWEAEAFAEAGADFVYAALMPALPEALGMAEALSDCGLPYLISFTIRADGCLVDGNRICNAIDRIDRETERPPLGYMANCVHPRIVKEALLQPFNRIDEVRDRFIGLQANTSDLPYEELDRATLLQTTGSAQLAREMMELDEVHPLRIFGGCCGTDRRHMMEIARRIGNRV